jgi:DNA-binding response OmpR family regulator
MAVVLLTGDLMGASRVEGAARQAGVELRMATNADAALDCCSVEDVALVVIDLSTSSLDVSALVARLKGRTGHVPAIVAYGPHVHEETLISARAAGCDEVFSRGQFLSQGGAIIARYAGSDPCDTD